MNLSSIKQLHHDWRSVIALALLLGLAACVPVSAPTGPAPVATTVEEEAAIPETTPMTDTATITATAHLTETATVTDTDPLPADPGMSDLSAGEQQLVERAREIVAAETGVPAADLTLVEIQAVEWSDSSLGCPQPGNMYMQVIMPGYQITLEDANGATYDVHTAGDPNGPLVLCPEAAAPTAGDQGTVDLSGVLTGTVTYRQRIALPAGSVITVELQDISRADAAATVIASQTITTTGENVPIPFVLSYDPTQVDPRFSYVVRAQILIDGELRWTSTERYAALTNSNPTTGMEIVVMPVQ